MPKIFVSYRRTDSQERAHRIADWLVLKYGKENVFIDVDTIGGGVDFVQTIEDSLRQTDVLLIIIGEQWVSVLNERLNQNETDLVRFEVRTGLERIPLVIPILTQQNIDIRATQLPEDIKPMMRRNFRFARGGMDFHGDMERIMHEIDEHFPDVEPEQPVAEVVTDKKRSIPYLPIVIVLVVIGVIIGIIANQPPEPPTNGGNTGIESPTPEVNETDEPVAPPPVTDTLSPTPNVAEAAQTLIAEQTAQKIIDNATETKQVSRNQTATATLWTKTPTPDYTASVAALLTEWVQATRTQSAIETATQLPQDITATYNAQTTETALAMIEATQTKETENRQATQTATLWTVTPSITPTPSNTPTLSPIQIALTPVNSNDEWTVVEESFNGIEMMLVPIGCFTMGNDDGRDDEKPAHVQCIDNPFWIDKTEVMQSDFARLGGDKAELSTFLRSQKPVETITWFEAGEFCESRNGRLPTEKEWEYVARGPDNLVYPWGNTFDADRAVYLRNSNELTSVVASRENASWIGAYDLSGNVWEWTSSIYTESYPYTIAQENDRDLSSNRIARGGSYYGLDNILRNANRTSYAPNSAHEYIGFRCVIDIGS